MNVLKTLVPLLAPAQALLGVPAAVAAVAMAAQLESAIAAVAPVTSLGRFQEAI